MGFTNAGLTNGGKTARFTVVYDESLSQADGPDRANAFLAACEGDLTIIDNWFSGVEFTFSFPIPIQITPAGGGAGWADPADIVHAFDASAPTVTINPGPGTPAGIVRYMMVSEVVEMYMASQGAGWYEPASLLKGGDEGSMGEGLSRFLGVQFLRAKGIASVPPAVFAVSTQWLNGARQDFVNNAPDDHKSDQVTGCSTLFIYYLHDQLRHSINAIIAAGPGAKKLADVYKSLTGRDDGWDAFTKLLNDHYPPGVAYNPAGDTVFPVSELAAFQAPAQIAPGGSDALTVTLDLPAMAEVNVRLTSDNPGLVVVPAQVTVPVGATSVTAPVTGANPPSAESTPVAIHAAYAGNTLSQTITFTPPIVIGLRLASNPVIAGDSTTATVLLNEGSLVGPVNVTLTNFDPAFATIPASLTIPKGQPSGPFTVQTPDMPTPFVSRRVEIAASFGGASTSAVLTVIPRVASGILKSLTLRPTPVPAGETTIGTVTLEEAAPTDTVVSLAALPGGSAEPLPGDGSSIVSVPPSVTIAAGDLSKTFTVATSPENVAPHTRVSVTILASAAVSKFAILEVEG